MIATTTDPTIVVLDQEDRADRARRAEAAELHRLALAARTAGIAIHRRPGSVESYWASDPNMPGDIMHLTGFSCSCDVFIRHARCRHHAALLGYLNWLPPMSCQCAGRGYYEVASGAYRACGCEASRKLGTRRRPGKAVARG